MGPSTRKHCLFIETDILVCHFSRLKLLAIICVNHWIYTWIIGSVKLVSKHIVLFSANWITYPCWITLLDWLILVSNWDRRFVMPPPLGAGGIMFSGCPSVRPSVPPSVRPSVRSLKYPLLTCTWVRWSTRPTVTVLRHVRPSVRLSVRPSVRRGFRAFAGERMEEMASNFARWCILTTSRTD